jgi:hypothetical protein
MSCGKLRALLPRCLSRWSVSSSLDNLKLKAHRALGNLTDVFETATGSDARKRAPVTLTGVNQEQFDEMAVKVAGLEGREPSLDAASRKKLDTGHVLTSWAFLDSGLVEEYTRGVVALPMDELRQRLPIEDWGKRQLDWKGGDVVELGPGRRVERMLIRMAGKDLDMTRIQQFSDTRDAEGRLVRSQVRWEVLKSDNGTVNTDFGTLKFERFGAKTLITWHSAHKLSAGPFNSDAVPAGPRDVLLGKSLTDFFRREILSYRAMLGF